MTEGRTPDPHRPGGAGVGWAVVGTLLAGIVVWGGAGWLLDRWLGTSFLVAIGVILGTAASVYLVVVKYGK
jgi:F0F1-type ATP synthase assembly protein I